MYVAGIDIGYSNLKVVHGLNTERNPQVVTYAAGAAPASSVGFDLRRNQPGASVLVDGEPWLAGVSQQRVMHTALRCLTRNYPDTPTYRALFNFALLQTGQERIDHLVTGLPVSEHRDTARVEALEARLTGKHEVAEGVTIQVDRVTVAPQPAGALMVACGRLDLVDHIDRGMVIVIDPGFFSMDWLTLEASQVLHSLSGTNTRAVSAVLERTADLIQKDTGARPPLAMLEQALRTRADNILLTKTPLDYRPMVAEAAKQVGLEALHEIVNQMRHAGRTPALAILTGGGAEIYAEVLHDLMPDTRVECLENPVRANAVGFWLAGR